MPISCVFKPLGVVVVRTGCGFQVGLGHLRRCQALAASLKACGADVLWLLDAMTVQEQAMAVQILPPAVSITWVSILTDSIATVLQDENTFFDWLIVDHYGLDEAWEQKNRSIARHLLVIDDKPGRAHPNASIVIDTNIQTRHCHVGPLWLCGPKFSLLPPHLDNSCLSAREEAVSRQELPLKIILASGGSDPAGLLGWLLEALAPLFTEFETVEWHVVAGPLNPLTQPAGLPVNVIWHASMPSMIPLLSGALVYVGAAGVTLTEAQSLGVYSLAFQVADNQRPAEHLLKLTGHGYYEGRWKSHEQTQLVQSRLQHLILNTDEYVISQQAAIFLVDGLGMLRIMKAMQMVRGKVN